MASGKPNISLDLNMPIRRRISRTAPQKYENLQKQLAEEWKNPRDDSGQPMIIIIGEEHEGIPIHIYVVWDEWSSISSQTDRSEIIMDTLDQLTDPVNVPDSSGFPDIARVTVAMGLTTEEAERMGIHAD